MNISASSYDAWHTCSRYWYWKHLVGLVPVREEGARRFGTMYHAGLEAWWAAMDGGDVPWRDKDAALVAALKAIVEDAAKHPDSDRFEVARARAMMVAYHARWYELEFEAYRDGPSVEVWFNLPLVDEDGREVPGGWRVTGRKDAIKRFSDGRIKPVEHKHSSSDISTGADYWARLEVDTQVSVYVDAAQRMGVETDRLLYDVSRKPAAKPLLATPEDRRKFTKGKGCKACGGRAGGKDGAAQGSGVIMVTNTVAGKKIDQQAACTECNGSGWAEAPRLHADQRTTDEADDEFARRVADEIAAEPDAYLRQADIVRSPDQIREMRADLVVTTGLIGSLTELARGKRDGVTSSEARRCFPRNTQSCCNHFGRSCDYLLVCSGKTNPWTGGLYQIKKKR